VLVSFHVRRGRLCDWSQSGCDQAVARPLTALTPVAWREFAHCNADIAAALQLVPAADGDRSSASGAMP
jgi:hypothetical protein